MKHEGEREEKRGCTTSDGIRMDVCIPPPISLGKAVR